MRNVYNMNTDWYYFDGDIKNTNFNSVHETFDNPSFMKSANCGISVAGYDTSDWEQVTVPHDFRHYKAEYDPVNGIASQGYFTTGIAWYRKEFFLEESHRGESVVLDFDGIFRNSEIYVNGSFVGRHLSGYTSMSFDVSDFILFGKNNAVAVRVDATHYEGWWYEGAGIYRDVRMVTTDRLKVTHDGVFVQPVVSGEKANLKISVELENESAKSGNATVTYKVVAPCGDVVNTTTQDVAITEYEGTTVNTEIEISDIVRWDIDATNQYKLEVAVSYNGEEVDTYTQKFGIREIQITEDKGVILNGRQIKVQGVCVHDDFAGVGGAMSRSVIRHKIYLLKQMGCNGYRCSHNPPSPYLLEACDDFGLLVMDEVRLMSSSEEYMTQMTDLIKRDRNHPSVFIWSIGNEEMAVHGTEFALTIVNHLLRVAHKTDPSRPCTYANNCNWKELTDWHEAHGLHMDVFGFNYNCMRNFQYYGYIHDKYPERAMIGTENASTLTTRGQYLPRAEEMDESKVQRRAEGVMIWSNPEREWNTSAYGDAYPTWGANPMEVMAAADYDYVSGYFIWTGFDYRGETIPFAWPSVVSRFGIMDLCGFMKDVGHEYRVKWASEPTVHLYPHWTFGDYEGDLEVDIVSNTDEVELFVNGVSQGRQVSPKWEKVKYTVPYKAGEIIAVAYNDGVEVTRTSHKTAGAPAKVNLEIVQDREYIANGEDNIFIKVEVLDKDGIHCPTADNKIKFSVTGEGEFLGCGNGDPLCLDDDQVPARNLFNGLALAILKTSRNVGDITFTATSTGLESATITVKSTIEATDVLATSAKDLGEGAQREKDDSDGAL